MRSVVLFAFLLHVIPAVVQAKTLEELLVEKGIVSERELAAVDDPGGAKVYWNKGTRLEFPSTGFSLQMTTQLQPRYEFTDNSAGAENESSFSLRRARLQIHGTALNSEFAYRVQAELAEEAELLDAVVDWRPCEGAGIRFGQFKSGIGRQYVNGIDSQFNNSSSTLQFVERSMVTDAFLLGRQTGAAAYLSFLDDKLKVQGQILNGESDGEGQNLPGVDTNHTLVAMARLAAIGTIDPYTEGDFNWSDELGMDIGAAYAYSNKTITGNDFGDHTVNVDLNLKSAGASLAGELFWRDEEETTAEPLGFYAQAGYFLMPRTFEIAIRGGMLDCDDGLATVGNCVGNDDITTAELSFNYFFWKHYLKAQLGYAHIEEDPMSGDETLKTNRWIFQVSSYF